MSEIKLPLKKPAAGITDFEELITGNYYYVDKTPFFKRFLERGNYVLLIGRARGFGKTLFLDSLAKFISINHQDPADTSYQQRLFKGTAILEDKAFCEEYMGKYPVILLSLSQVKGKTVEEVTQNLAKAVTRAAAPHADLLNSEKLNEREKNRLKRMLDPEYLASKEGYISLVSSVEDLTEMLEKCFGKRAFVLVDDYDIPFISSAKYGYNEKMKCLVGSIYLSSLKDNSSLQQGLMTGACKIITDESIFSGFNNYTDNTTAEDRGYYAECMGFTPSEVAAMLDYFDLSDKSESVHSWYGGYSIGGKELYSPTSVVKFCAQRQEPCITWSFDENDDHLLAIFNKLHRDEIELLDKLMDGKDASLFLNTYIDHTRYWDGSYREDLWSLLLFKGYFSMVAIDYSAGFNPLCTVRIPNNEIRAVFAKYINEHNKSLSISDRATALIPALLNEDHIAWGIRQAIDDYIFVRDPSCTEDSLYHHILHRSFSCKSDLIANYKYCFASGTDDADFCFTSKDGAQAVVIKLEALESAKQLRLDEKDKLTTSLNINKYKDYYANLGIKSVKYYTLFYYEREFYIREEFSKRK